jgi:hypothetical protein
MSRQVFDAAEAAADSLHAMAGVEDALIEYLDPLLAAAPARERGILALIAALQRFRAEAQGRVAEIARAACGPEGRA